MFEVSEYASQSFPKLNDDVWKMLVLIDQQNRTQKYSVNNQIWQKKTGRVKI